MLQHVSASLVMKLCKPYALDFMCNLIFFHGHETSPFNYFTWLLNAKEIQFVVAISLLLNSNCTFRWSPSITAWIYRQWASVQVYSSAWSRICCEVCFSALTWKSLWHCPTVRLFGFLCAGYTLVLICWQIMASSMVGLMKKNNEPWFGELRWTCNVQEAVSIWRSSLCSGDGDCREERK